MADNRRFVQAQKFTIAVGISTTDTSITLQSFNFPDGTAIAAGDLGSINYGTLEPGTSREESISFTGITSNVDGTVTLTGVTRGLGFGAVDTYSEQSNLKSQHGTGAIFILSNTAAFYNDFVNKNNDEEMTGTLSVLTPTSATHAATKQYVDDNVNGGAVSNDRIVQAATAGESVAAGNLVYFDDTDNEWKKTVGTTAATLNNVLLGIAQGSGSDGGAITGGVLTYGLDSTQTGLTAGVKLYAGDTAGAIVETAGNVERVIGWSKSATEIYFDANVEYTPTASEKDAMAGGGDFGTPSASNKFLTEDWTASASGAPVVETFTSSGTWTKDAGLKYVVVEVVAGGGGGGTGFEDAAGGGAGGYSRKTILASALGASETVTVGSGGAAGSAGSTSSFGLHCSSSGGAAGGLYNSPGGGGTATGGDINVRGGPGILATNVAGGNSENGSGGSSYFGGGGAGDLNGNQAGETNSGGGGSGGAAGGSGVVIVTEYYS